MYLCAQVVRNFPDLETLEMGGCFQVDSIEPLRDCKNLLYRQATGSSVIPDYREPVTTPTAESICPDTVKPIKLLDCK